LALVWSGFSKEKEDPQVGWNGGESPSSSDDLTMMRTIRAKYSKRRPARTLKIDAISGLAAYRRKVPSAAWHAAHIATAMAEDCGPCTQLCVTMAERDGVSAAVLRAVLGQNVHAMPPEVALTFRFARAVQDQDPLADQLREGIGRPRGHAAVVSLALSMASGRFFPFVKYALGHGRACTRVVVDGAPSL
jgi:hypothetical protein